MKSLMLCILVVTMINSAQGAELRFAKVHQQGQIISPKSGPWHCVLDKQTGLLWEVKSAQEGAHYYKSTYSWWERQSSQGSEKGGSCAVGDGFVPCDSQDLVDLYNQLELCGVKNWRVPQLDELSSLVNSSAYPGQPLVPAGLFPLTVKGPYWTQTWSDDNKQLAMVHFGSGEVGFLKPSGAAWLRLVSSVKGHSSSANQQHNQDKEQ
ncbi:DUF1566 domain-containing protein [Motilimonas sp. E26]|uniref:Lcl C-terminal domain-containing protein n=1 Tax=Motilimonas sp. E26 TaxID=2865674 RepID=UPI001E3E9C41|nr:DUF1566 domain-containing protein [Motilimonas sp. E26]MCE0556826.1 DUF1566 domain-containing protein [Motilimonas sp. E26]